jgi:prepilin-type N-terminal cleavage/methylation domain-containing protein
MLRNRRSSNDLSGFTLVEIIVVIVIMAIAAAVIIPHAIGTSDVQAVSGARILASDLQYAENTAITSQSPVTVTFDVAGESYTLSNASGPLIHPITKGAYVVSFASQRGFDNLDIASASFGGNVMVTFDELGAPDNAGSVTLQAGPHVYRVDVAAATGNVTVTNLGS